MAARHGRELFRACAAWRLSGPRNSLISAACKSRQLMRSTGNSISTGARSTALIKLVSKLIRADGKLNNDLLTPESFPKQILEKIQTAALSDALRAHEATSEMLKEITARQKAIDASLKSCVR